MASRLPPANSETAGFWENAARGVLVVQHCPACGHRQFFPRAVCIHCMCPEPEWQPVSGFGTVHSFSVVHRPAHPDFAQRVPYVIAVIDLDEGVRMFSNIVGTTPDAVRVGQRVRVTFQPEAGDRVLPVFAPA